MSGRAADAPPSREGRLGNVSAALLLDGGAPTDAARATAEATRLAGLFLDVMLVGGRPPAGAPGRPVPEVDGPAGPLRALVSALEAARAERVLVLSAAHGAVPSDLLLALTVFPDAPAVVPRTAAGPQPLCAIYGRAEALPAARRALDRGAPSLPEWIGTLEPRFFEGEALAQLLPEDVFGEGD